MMAAGLINEVSHCDGGGGDDDDDGIMAVSVMVM